MKAYYGWVEVEKKKATRIYWKIIAFQIVAMIVFAILVAMMFRYANYVDNTIMKGGI